MKHKKISLPVLSDFSQSMRDRVLSMSYTELCALAILVMEEMPQGKNSMVLACCAELIARKYIKQIDFSKYRKVGNND